MANLSKRLNQQSTPMVVLGYVLWLGLAFVVVQLFIAIVLQTVFSVFAISIESINVAVFSFVIAALSYLLTLAAVIYVPKKWFTKPTSRKELGVHSELKWRDIGFALVGFIPYALLSSALVTAVAFLFPSVDLDQVQELGFDTNIYGFELILAFIALVVIAPLAEEILFRGYLYGKIRARAGMIASIVVVSLVFAVLHGQLNVGIDVFVLSVVLCLFRELTGTIWAGVVLHMIKNGLAFYILFINPSLLSTMGA